MVKGVTKEQMLACYDLVRKHLLHESDYSKNRQGVVKILVEEQRMNPVTASQHISFIVGVLRGEFKSGYMSVSNGKILFERVFEDYGDEGGEIYLAGLEKHIEYLENRGDGKFTKTRQRLYDELSQRLAELKRRR